MIRTGYKESVSSLSLYGYDLCMLPFHIKLFSNDVCKMLITVAGSLLPVQ